MKNVSAHEFLRDPGKIIAEVRKASGMNQKELADRSDISYDIISAVEHNKRDFRISTYQKILAGLTAKKTDGNAG